MKKPLYSGKTKSIFEHEPGLYLMEFRNDITAGDGVKHEVMENKGYYSSEISAKLFEVLNASGVKTHFVKKLGDSRFLVRSLKMCPVEFVCRNIAAGHLVKSYYMFKDGQKLDRPILQMFLKDDERHDPLINESTVLSAGLLKKERIKEMEDMTLKVNDVLKKVFDNAGITLVDFKLEFGFDENGAVRVGDEISPDSMRLWDKKTSKILDKDVFRKDLGDVMSVYEEVAKRIGAV
ncbi:MAG: phosphoribosylaminoimidazolesuccinocarboxamide synthase [Candidatus Altiarchaeales archaeon IMC4]|nr:MAG: phosphoribosylaminoimidazolesuccinocarboxamide synthase [Candidatus Altiarchaeales archaeon IMC4]